MIRRLPRRAIDLLYTHALAHARTHMLHIHSSNNNATFRIAAQRSSARHSKAHVRNNGPEGRGLTGGGRLCVHRDAHR
jgi:hypothetical protein